MKPWLRTLIHGTLTAVLLLNGLFVFAPKVHAFDQNMLISDAMFDNSGTMNASDIDAFLNRYSNSCISLNHGFRAPDPNGYSPSTGFTYGVDVSAGTIIYDAAQAYGINPQVILTTLQKEQALVTGGQGCSTSRYVGAMGNGCPDGNQGHDYSGFELYAINGVPTNSVSGTCVNSASMAGFSRQIIVAVWRLKFWEQRSEGNTSWAVIKPGWDNSDDPPSCYSLRMTQGYRARCRNDTPTYFDGQASIDSTTVSLTNGATAALYNYTPHLHGNQNFVDIFENSFNFGSTTSGMLNIAHPNGTLVRPANSPQVYLITGGKAQYATSQAVLQSWGYDLSRLKIATQGDLNFMAAADADTSHTNNPTPLQYREGTLIKGAGPTIYVIQNVGGANTKVSVGDWDTFVRLGYTFGQVLVVSDAQLPAATGSALGANTTNHPNGSLIRDAGSPTVYIIIAGERHSLSALPYFVSHGLKFPNVVTATSGDTQLPLTWPVNWFGEGTLVRGSGPTVYIVDGSGVNQQKRSFGNYYKFVGLDYRFSEVMQVNDGELPSQNGPDIGQ